MSSHVTIAKVNCQESNDLCQKYHITGVPSLKLFSVSEDDDKRLILDYTGPRTLNEMINFSKRHISSFVYKVLTERTFGQRSGYKRTIFIDDFIQKVCLLCD